ncbi:hypothetical protein [Wolbachia endosymbiont (group B) of Silvanus unidentatus]|uniref:hypothetical protein n=1 Tax=Wolbachia endosymbiont (group B) of Silvanus unidentatus TaxID=3066137 RepID=UPI0033410984
MWKSIQKLFKWIADHTGISWITKKVSSGWNWLFSSKANAAQKSTSPERPLGENVNKSNTLPKTLDGNQLILPKQIDRPKVCLEVIDGELLLTMINKNYKILEEKHKNPCQYNEFHAFVRCESGDFHITGPYLSQKSIGGERKSVSITSVKKQIDEGSVLSNPLEMIRVLGLGKNKEFVKVDKINYKPLKTKKTSVVGGLEFEGNNFWLNLEECINIKDYKSSLTKNAYHPKFLVYLKCNKGEYCITGRSVNSPEYVKHLIVESIIEKNKDGKYIDSDKILVQDSIENVKKMLGLENDVTEIKVGSISNQPFESITPTITAQQAGDNTTIDPLAVTRESSTINIFNGNLELRLADDIQQNLEDYKHPRNKGKYRMKIHCNKNDFNINFSKRDNDDGSVSLIINILQKDKLQLFHVWKMKKSLGFKKGSTFVVIDSIESFKAPTNNGVPSSETTSLEAKNANCNKSLLVNAHKEKDEHNTDASHKIIQQEVNNEDNEQEKFYDAEKELDGDFHDAFFIPEEARLKFSQELSNYLSKARSSEIRRLLCDEVVPNSLLIRLIVEEKLASNNCSC